MKRPSFLNKHRTKNNNGYELNTSTSSSSSSSNTPNNSNTSNNKEEKEVVLSSISVLCNESKSHTKKHNTNRSSSSNNSSSSPHADARGIVSQSNIGNCGLVLSTHADFTDTNAVDELVLNSTTILNNISLEDSYSTSEQAEILPSSVAVFVDDLILCGNTSSKQSKNKSTTFVQVQPTVNAKEQVEGVGEVEGKGEASTNVTEFNVSFGSADFDYFVGNRFTDLSANDEREHEKEKTGEKKTGESSNKETNESINKEKTDNVRYTMVEDNKTSKGGKKAKKKGGNNNKSSLAEFSNTFNDDTFSISLASTANNSNDISSYTQQDSLTQVSIDSASQQYINEHIQILLDTILLPADVLLPKSVKKEVSHTILPAFQSTANDVTDNIELILTLPADYIANALYTSPSNNDEKKKVDSRMDKVSSFINSVNAGYASVSKSKSAKGNVSSSILNESNISNETIKTSNLLFCGSGNSCIERDFLYNTCVDQ